MDSFNILLLEDDFAFREAVTEELTEAGYHVTPVAGGTEAVARIAEISYDLVIVDIRMKGIDGLEALARMRDHQQDLACIVMTGFAEEEAAVRAARLGVRGYLRKPFKLRELLDCVEGVVRGQRRRRSQEEVYEELAESLRWSARAISKLSGKPELEQAVEVAEALTGHLGWDPLRCARTQLLASAAGAGLSPPATLAEAALNLPERWDGTGPRAVQGEAIPLDARVVSLALAKAAGQPPAGQCDPYLLDSLERLSPPEGRQAWRRRRKLLGLGQTLLQIGELSGAAVAFAEIVRGQPEGPDAVTAYLGWSRCCPGQEGEQLLEKALECARRAGPLVQARCCLEVGLRLREAQPDRARELLHQALDGLGEGSEREVTRLALWQPPAPFPTHELKRVLGPRTEAAAGWMLPLVAQGLSEGYLERALATRYFLGHPASIIGALERGVLDPRQRAAVAGCLTPQGWPHRLVELLKDDPDPQVRKAANGSLAAAVEGQLPILRIYSLGAFEVLVGESPIGGKQWKGNKNRYLLALLASREAPASDEVLIDIFWPDSHETGKRGLYNAVSLYRRILKPEGWEGPTDYIQRDLTGIGLNPEREHWHDLSELRGLLRELKDEVQAERAVVRGRQVVDLYRGPYLDGCYLDWAIRQRDSLELEVIEGLLTAAGLASGAELYQEAMELSGQVCEYDNCNQPSHLLYMESCLSLGRPEQALRRFGDLEKALSREMGIEPSTDLLRAYHKAKLL
ncbi:MAG: response regulator [Vulcanimicrobiota bacterium]